MTITYVYGKNLYINMTNRCPNRCEFCLRNTGDRVGDSDSLWLEREPTVEEIMDSLTARDLDRYDQIVFCGFGEPTVRLDDLLEVARRLKESTDTPIRLNTSGLSDLLHRKKTAPLFKGLLDSISISLNASTPEKYDALCHSAFGLQALPAILRFTEEVRQYVPYVRMTVVDTMEPEELEACRRLCAETGADFVVRTYETDWVTPDK